MKIKFLDLRVKDPKFVKKILKKTSKILFSGKILEGKDQKIFEKRFGSDLINNKILRLSIL